MKGCLEEQNGIGSTGRYTQTVVKLVIPYCSAYLLANLRLVSKKLRDVIDGTSSHFSLPRGASLQPARLTTTRPMLTALALTPSHLQMRPDLRSLEPYLTSLAIRSNLRGAAWQRSGQGAVILLLSRIAPLRRLRHLSLGDCIVADSWDVLITLRRLKILDLGGMLEVDNKILPVLPLLGRLQELSLPGPEGYSPRYNQCSAHGFVLCLRQLRSISVSAPSSGSRRRVNLPPTGSFENLLDLPRDPKESNAASPFASTAADLGSVRGMTRLELRGLSYSRHGPDALRHSRPCPLAEPLALQVLVESLPGLQALVLEEASGSRGHISKALSGGWGGEVGHSQPCVGDLEPASALTLLAHQSVPVQAPAARGPAATRAVAAASAAAHAAARPCAAARNHALAHGDDGDGKDGIPSHLLLGVPHHSDSSATDSDSDTDGGFGPPSGTVSDLPPGQNCPLLQQCLHFEVLSRLRGLTSLAISAHVALEYREGEQRAPTSGAATAPVCDGLLLRWLSPQPGTAPENPSAVAIPAVAPPAFKSAPIPGSCAAATTGGTGGDVACVDLAGGVRPQQHNGMSFGQPPPRPPLLAAAAVMVAPGAQVPGGLCWPQLQELSLRELWDVGQAGLAAVCRGLCGLRSLDLSGSGRGLAPAEALAELASLTGLTRLALARATRCAWCLPDPFGGRLVEEDECVQSLAEPLCVGGPEEDADPLRVVPVLPGMSWQQALFGRGGGGGMAGDAAAGAGAFVSSHGVGVAQQAAAPAVAAAVATATARNITCAGVAGGGGGGVGAGEAGTGATAAVAPAAQGQPCLNVFCHRMLRQDAAGGGAALEEAAGAGQVHETWQGGVGLLDKLFHLQQQQHQGPQLSEEFYQDIDWDEFVDAQHSVVLESENVLLALPSPPGAKHPATCPPSPRASPTGAPPAAAHLSVNDGLYHVTPISASAAAAGAAGGVLRQPAVRRRSARADDADRYTGDLIPTAAGPTASCRYPRVGALATLLAAARLQQVSDTAPVDAGTCVEGATAAAPMTGLDIPTPTPAADTPLPIPRLHCSGVPRAVLSTRACSPPCSRSLPLPMLTAAHHHSRQHSTVQYRSSLAWSSNRAADARHASAVGTPPSNTVWQPASVLLRRRSALGAPQQAPQFPMYARRLSAAVQTPGTVAGCMTRLHASIGAAPGPLVLSAVDPGGCGGGEIGSGGAGAATGGGGCRSRLAGGLGLSPSGDGKEDTKTAEEQEEVAAAEEEQHEEEDTVDEMVVVAVRDLVASLPCLEDLDLGGWPVTAPMLRRLAAVASGTATNRPGPGPGLAAVAAAAAAPVVGPGRAPCGGNCSGWQAAGEGEGVAAAAAGRRRPELRRLGLAACQLDRAAAAALTRFTGLQHVDISWSRPEGFLLRSLAAMRDLEAVEVRGCRLYYDSGKALQQLAAVKAVRGLADVSGLELTMGLKQEHVLL